MKLLFSLLFIITPVFLLAYECERVKISTPCYGECGNFIDENENGICDRWEIYQRQKKEESIINKTIETKDKKDTIQVAMQDGYNKIYYTDKSKDNRKLEKNSFLRYGILWIVIINLLLIIITELFKKNFLFFGVRSFWNWVLFLSFTMCALTGFFMYFDLFVELRSLWFALHIQTSFISFITGFYHIILRYKCVWPFSKN
ncbi:MAG: DUF4405 domain-containing protein [Elusimicrobiota bacterium]